ncbi:MAG: Transcriptional repressor NrdR [Candidatus Moranbacteria bacterium GW2011_GWE1_49_15]|nr:MAG: Transcriptional repressor NrdR [Candidatus Moranbacteria bacterium GW2011_GWE2_47_10]KKW07024.1 MAG: Transcriptional repressor NrdR [Candidatus Moranbacteria bacterium GW2011_GWE1_49_15]HBP01497.1 transcriptional regulator NrdR [Candidatus Moranbacteria bacterium]
MVCPFCGHGDTKVVDSRDTNDGRAIRRRRECEKCQSRFSTYEEMEIMKLTVLKRDGAKQEYDKRKIAAGLRKALEKRPVSEERIQKAIGDIEYEIQARESSEIKSKEIGKMVLEKLRELDEVAYIRFASVYKSFKSVESFKKEMENLELEKV